MVFLSRGDIPVSAQGAMYQRIETPWGRVERMHRAFPTSESKWLEDMGEKLKIVREKDLRLELGLIYAWPSSL